MTSKADLVFWKQYHALPESVRPLARKTYQRWLQNSFHPSLRFKKIKGELWSIRIGEHYRAIGYFLDAETFVWIWIGTHEDYNKF
ncbi:MAG TPA: hypothetical protein VK737_01635 [Opitutales bacterium]|jgi:hypothetical protein|nr:hypothetical protein [Opitutales bacterium]